MSATLVKGLREDIGFTMSAFITRLLLLVMLIAIGTITLGYPLSQHEEGLNKNLFWNSSQTVIVNVPAVTGNQGKLIKVIVKPSDKPGVVFTGTVDVGEDTYASAWTAFLVASLLSGKSPFESGIEISIFTDSDNVEGPSASLAIAIASYIIKEGHSKPAALNEYSITGAISLDGASVIVGGTPEKLEATITSGLRRMIVPAANAFLLEESGASPEDYVPVYGVLDGLDALYGRKSVILPTRTEYPYALSEFLRTIGETFINKAQENLDELKDGEKENVINYYINASNNALGRGKLYTYASLAYTAYLASVSMKYENADKKELERIYEQTYAKLEEIKKHIMLYEEELYAKDEIGQFELEILAIAESRAWMCEALLTEYKNSDLIEEIRKNSLIQAIARCETAATWIKALEIDWGEQPKLKVDILEKTIDEYQVFLDYAMTYVESAVEMDVIPTQVRIYFEELKDLASRIKESSRKGSPGLRLGLSVELSSRLATFLTQMNSMQPTLMERYVEELWRNLEVLNGHLASYGRVSLMASLYAEYAQYEGHDPVSKVALLDTAIASVQPLLIYSLIEHQGTNTLGELSLNEVVERVVLAESYQLWLIIGILATIVGIAFTSLYNGKVD